MTLHRFDNLRPEVKQELYRAARSADNVEVDDDSDNHITLSIEDDESLLDMLQSQEADERNSENYFYAGANRDAAREVRRKIA